jgi:hypothetical protein
MSSPDQIAVSPDSLDRRTPDQAYFTRLPQIAAA